MTGRKNSGETRPDRRAILRHMARGAAALGMAAMASRAQAQVRSIEDLIAQTERGEYGPGFEAAAPPVQRHSASLPTLSSTTAQNTERAISSYRAIVTHGGWPIVPRIERLRTGHRHPAIAALRQRLIVSGDLVPPAGMNEVFDASVEEAVRRFQLRHGLAADGLVREPTLRAINIPAATRLDQLHTNAIRLRIMSGDLGPRFVVCNIPAAQIEAIENGVAVTRHNAIVGKPDRPSPDIQSGIVEVNFNPYWRVPVSIVRRDLIPKMQEEPDYLAINRIRIIDRYGLELAPAQINWFSQEAANYRFTQDPAAGLR